MSVWQQPTSICGQFYLSKHFLGAVCLQKRAQECLLAEYLACDQKLQLGMGEVGKDTIVSHENRDAGGHLPAPSDLLARPGRWEQRSFC